MKGTRGTIIALIVIFLIAVALTSGPTYTLMRFN